MASEAFEDIVENFEFMDDWEDRYRYVIEMGKAMEPLEDAFKVDATKVDGCTSQVWIVPMVEGQGGDAIFNFRGDSDAMIVRGLVAVLVAMFNGLTVAEVTKVNASQQLARLQLNDNLSAQRSNGLRAMVQRIGKIAADTVAAG
jgi:cysteine desulfuration protein SufE